MLLVSTLLALSRVSALCLLIAALFAGVRLVSLLARSEDLRTRVQTLEQKIGRSLPPLGK